MRHPARSKAAEDNAFGGCVETRHFPLHDDLMHRAAPAAMKMGREWKNREQIEGVENAGAITHGKLPEEKTVRYQ